MKKIQLRNKLYYPRSEYGKRTKSRLKELIALNIEVVCFGEFGIRNIVSGIYIEKVWNMPDYKWSEYVLWIESVINTKKLN